MDLIKWHKETHKERIEFYNMVLKYTNHSIGKKIAKRNLEFHKWAFSLVR